ncbi:hypothetical protein [Streptomyces platensis]|uniref:hypothetical protein n=1 Tax=Streptomyces platensis TaxID=58346 RepID=UPI0036986EF9
MSDLTTIELPFAFSVPEGFEAVDFARSPVERAEKTVEKLSSLTPKPTDEEMLHAVITQQSMVDLLAESGCVYAGILLTRSSAQEHAPASLMLTVNVRPSELDNSDTLERLATTLAATHPDAEVGVVVLPIGPAVLLTEDTGVGQAANLLDVAEATKVRQLHAFVPIPGRTAMADFSISTENTADWDDYVDILAAVCRTIELTE